MATPRDVQEIVTRLSSSKAKVREEGVKLLNGWLEEERSFSFCRLLAHNTSLLRPDEVPHDVTWPFLITLTTKCIGLEKAASKKSYPKLIWAKTLRIAIQHAEDPKFSGKPLLLLSVVNLIFSHIWDVIKDVPLFQSEYGIILRQLLAVKEYRYHMRKRIYCSLLLLYMKRVEMSLATNSEIHLSTREEIFRCVLTLHTLLGCPPGDFPDNIRENVIKNFCNIFSHLREEGKISRKLMECINLYLLKDGPNLGSKAMEIHYHLHDFIFRYWLTTHDRGLKTAFILYAKLQLKLVRGAERGPFIEQLLDVIGKELDQAVSNVSTSWSESTKDDKIGPSTSSSQGLMEIAASVLYQASVNPLKASIAEKRLKKEGAFDRLRDGLVKGKWLWCGTFCFLIRNYGIRIDQSSLASWLKCISKSLERNLSDSCITHSYDGVLWILRGLQKLAFVFSHCPLTKCSLPIDEVRGSWLTIWRCLLHGLPMLSNMIHVADAALVLLGNTILEDLVNVSIVPQEVWELQIFKQMPLCALYFITCYFSRGGVQGNHHDVLHLRKKLLRSAMQLTNSKESVLDKQTATVLPAAIFSLCVGYCPFLPSCIYPVQVEEWSKFQENDDFVDKFLDHSVEVLSEFGCDSNHEMVEQENNYSVRVPKEIKGQLVHEMEQYFLASINLDQLIEQRIISNIFSYCLFLSNCVYSLSLTRLMNERSPLCSKMLGYMLKLLELIVPIMVEKRNGIQLSDSSLMSVPEFSGSVLASLCCFLKSPLFQLLGDGSVIDGMLSKNIIQCIENLLLFLAKLFEDVYSCANVSEVTALFPSSHSSQHLSSMPDQGKRIIDVDLDVDEGLSDLDSVAVSGDSTSAFVQWKMDMISTISVFFIVLPATTHDIMANLLEKESDPKVAEYILTKLCMHYPLSDGALGSLVTLMNKIMDSTVNPNILYSTILSAINGLLGSLISSRNSKRNGASMQYCGQTVPEQDLTSLGDFVHKLSEENLSDWSARLMVIECICNFILIDPSIGQGMISGLFVLLKDPDYRVRLFLARRIGVLFQTWDGHDELLHDICSNFGFNMVMATKDKLTIAGEVFATDSQPYLSMETAVISLAHIAIYSDKVELEVVFMICAVAATSPVHRDLIYALLDKISRNLSYSSRMKYLEEILGPILSKWITCKLSLVSLVEIQDLFVARTEAKLFIQFCCQWLLPLLVIRQDIDSLNLVSMVACQSLSFLMRKHFVNVFAICMALCCSSKAEKEAGEVVLSNSILSIAEISEEERDGLIKKYMVSIVNCLLSLSSASSDPPMPFFSMEVVASAIKMVVDGFLEIDICSNSCGIIDKLNIFRPDRVFKFLVEIHYLITSAAHPRHKCNRFSAVEVLVKIIGHRATISSTSLYIFNLVGQFIVDPALQEQCCAIVSTLLMYFGGQDLVKDDVNVLGEQLQLLVSKLVVCYDGSTSAGVPSNIVSLLGQLILDADSSLYNYIRELEPLPDVACFERMQKFHNELRKECSPQVHFLKFVKKISHLPEKLVLWSIRSLHANLQLESLMRSETDIVDIPDGFNCWTKDPELVSAVWALIGVCASCETKEICSLVADFISRVGIGDPHRIVFHLPGNAIQHEFCGSYTHNNINEITIHNDFVVSEEVLINLLSLLKKFLLDDRVEVVDITARTLRGILSTELGQRALSTFNAYDRSLMSIHCKGVDSLTLEKLITDCEGKSMSGDISDLSLWKTNLKSYEMWICPLVQILIYESHDNILRLCQDMVLLKVEMAELLLPSVLVNLSGRQNTESNLSQLISKQVEENIFTKSNNLMKSIQVWLDALNVLRSHHVARRAQFSHMSSKQGKSSRIPRSCTPEKTKDPFTSTSMDSWPRFWTKVYWLSLDYLIVAKAAIHCGSYFTAIMYIEYWCEENFKSLTLGSPDFSHQEVLPPHIELLVSAATRINEPDSIYGIIRTYKICSQIVTHEHEGNWNKALEYYDLLIRKEGNGQANGFPCGTHTITGGSSDAASSANVGESGVWKLHKGIIRSLQQIGCSHILNVYLQGLSNQRGDFQHDRDFTELQYEAAWRCGNWDFSLFPIEDTSCLGQQTKEGHYNENLHSCLRALQEGDCGEFYEKLANAKKELVVSISNASKERTEYINSSIVKLQILDHLGMTWSLRWKHFEHRKKQNYNDDTIFKKILFSEPDIPTVSQLECIKKGSTLILKETQSHLNLLEPFIAFRHILLQILRCKESTAAHLLESASVFRKGSQLSLAAAALHEFRLLYSEEGERAISYMCSLGRLEEAKVLWAQGEQEMAINLARYLLKNCELAEETSNVYRLVGKWLAESRSSSSRTILEEYLKFSVELAELNKNFDRKSLFRKCQTYFQLAHYTDALFKSYEERLTSNEWQAALRLRKHRTRELDALIRRLKNSAKGDKTDYSSKIQELQKQLTMDREEAEKLQDDRDNFLGLALEGYQNCLLLGSKYDMRVVFRLVSLWFSFPSRQNIVRSMLNAIKEVQSHKFIPLMYQIASRMGNPKEGQGPLNFQAVLISLVKKMTIDHPYHTIFQLLALANGDRVKDKQRSRNSFIVDMDKKLAAENLLNELTSHHGAVIRQMKQMVDIYIKLAELETKREETNRRIPLPRELRSVRQLELVPVVTAAFPVESSCQYGEGSFPHFKGLGDSIIVMNGINAPKVVECIGSDGRKYRQLAKSGNDDLRQDAVMEQFFGLVNTFLQSNQYTWKRRLRIRTYKVVPFTPSAGVLEWVDQTVPLGEYLIGSQRNGGAHARYGIGDWSFPQCREHMTNEKDKRKAFDRVCTNFRPVMHYFFLERFLQPADWFEKRLSYTRSVAASSMVGYIVGLGDRHSMNILIDQASAEVIHIDLGVAFEQGLMLKTPERVPFRLTRDIVDGMGVTGVEGVFRRCCEETLSVMKTNKEALLTIVEVFIHDPLYKWALSPLKALQRQKETNEDVESDLEDSQDVCEGNKDAARALFRVKQKLDGYEDGEMRSVQGQVQQLIQDAIDTDRLCHMFPGWGAWL